MVLRTSLSLKEAEDQLRQAQRNYDNACHDFLLSLEDLPIVEAIISLIETLHLPTFLYDCWGMDTHDEQYRIQNVRIGAVNNYDYTDIVGLTPQQFNQVCQHFSQTQD